MCPCQSKRPFQTCCQPFLSGQHYPQTPEQLMRSRYTAYAMKNFVYIQASMAGKALSSFSLPHAEKWAESHTWISLVIKESSASETE